LLIDRWTAFAPGGSTGSGVDILEGLGQLESIPPSACTVSLGVLNGDLFTEVVAFAPGFFNPEGDRAGRPRFFLALGTQDPILPVTGARRIAARLTNEGCDVTFWEFEGGHQIPAEVAQEGLAWMFDEPAG
jgi:predicted esterase